MGKISEIAQDILDGITDLTTLDVVTITGTINITSSIEEDDTLDFQKLHKNLMSEVKVGGAAQFNVLALTHIEIDCDSTNFVKSNLSGEEMPLVTAHNEMVKTAQETRIGIVKMLGDLIKLGIRP